jgi:hypothetical protein
MGIIKRYHDKKWTLQFLAALYNSIDYVILQIVKYKITYYNNEYLKEKI